MNKAIQNKRDKYAAMLQAYEKDFQLERFAKSSSVWLLLPMLKQSTMPDERKSELVAKVILPKLEHYKNATRWRKRYYLINCFEYYIDERYYPILIQLIHDDISIISIDACQIGSGINDEKIYQAILELLQSEDHASRTLYIDNLKPNKLIYPFLLKQLEKTDDTLLKKIIYDILLQINCDESFYETAKKDSLLGEHNMRLAAIRILPHTGHKDCIHVLTLLLDDEDWRVRNVVVQALAALNDPEAMPLIADKIKDEEWWVKVTSAKMLSKLGAKGLDVLEDLKEHVPKETASYASYFLEIAKKERNNA